MSVTREGGTVQLIPAWVPPTARHQAGLFTPRQALEAGMTVEQVRHRRRTGLWVPFAGRTLRHRDVPVEFLGEIVAVRLTWPDAVACLHSAARMHQLPVPDDGVVRAVVGHARRAQVNLEPHRYALGQEDVVQAPWGSYTRLSRTVLDCLGALPERAAEELLVWVLTRHLVPHDHLVAALGRTRGLTGNAQRRRLLDATELGARSPAEHRLHVILQRIGVTGWQADQPVRDARGRIGAVDVLFRRERLVIEVDGMAYHGQARFQFDRTRQNRLVAAGFTVLRFTWSDLVDRPTAVGEAVLGTLRRLRTERP